MMDKSMVEKRDRLLLELTELLGASSDEYQIKMLKMVSPEYVKGYLNGIIEYGDEDSLLLMYQFIYLLHYSRT